MSSSAVPRKNRRRNRNKKVSSNSGTSEHPLYVRSAEPYFGGQAIDALEFPSRDRFSSAVFNVVQSTEITAAFTTSATLPTYFATSFTFSALDQVASFQSLFDQYRLMMVEITMLPRGINAGNSQGLVTSVVDYDDAVALTTVAQALDYTNALTVPIGAPIKRTFVPHAANALYAAGVFASFGNVARPWIDAQSPAVIHYGLKLAATVSSAVIVYDSVTRYWFQLRNIR